MFIPVLPLAFVLPANRLSFSFLRKTIIIGEIRRMHRIITYRLKRGTYWITTWLDPTCDAADKKQKVKKKIKNKKARKATVLGRCDDVDKKVSHK